MKSKPSQRKCFSLIVFCFHNAYYNKTIFSFIFQSLLDFNIVKAYKWVWATVSLRRRWSWNCQWGIGQGFLMCLSLYVNLWTGTRRLFYGWQQFKGIHLDMVDKGRRGSGEKNELMMLANISPCISILFRKWLSGFEAVWSSIVSDSQSRCDCTLNRAALLLTNTVHWGRAENALLSVPAAVRLFSWHSRWHLRRMVLSLVEFPAPACEHIGSQGSCKCLLTSMYGAYWRVYLPVIYAAFGKPDPPPKVNCRER